MFGSSDVPTKPPLLTLLRVCNMGQNQLMNIERLLVKFVVLHMALGKTKSFILLACRSRLVMKYKVISKRFVSEALPYLNEEKLH